MYFCVSYVSLRCSFPRILYFFVLLSRICLFLRVRCCWASCGMARRVFLCYELSHIALCSFTLLVLSYRYGFYALPLCAVFPMRIMPLVASCLFMLFFLHVRVRVHALLSPLSFDTPQIIYFGLSLGRGFSTGSGFLCTLSFGLSTFLLFRGRLTGAFFVVSPFAFL